MIKTRGPSKVFKEYEIKQLLMNPHVENVTEKSITYSPPFKLAAVKAYQEGQTPMEIFLRAGIDVNIIGRRKPKQCLNRWRTTYKTQGEAGLLEEQRGKRDLHFED
jgi:transposase